MFCAVCGVFSDVQPGSCRTLGQIMGAGHLGALAGLAQPRGLVRLLCNPKACVPHAHFQHLPLEKTGLCMGPWAYVGLHSCACLWIGKGIPPGLCLFPTATDCGMEMHVKPSANFTGRPLHRE